MSVGLIVVLGGYLLLPVALGFNAAQRLEALRIARSDKKNDAMPDELPRDVPANSRHCAKKRPASKWRRVS